MCGPGDLALLPLFEVLLPKLPCFQLALNSIFLLFLLDSIVKCFLSPACQIFEEVQWNADVDS